MLLYNVAINVQIKVEFSSQFWAQFYFLNEIIDLSSKTESIFAQSLVASLFPCLMQW